VNSLPKAVTRTHANHSATEPPFDDLYAVAKFSKSGVWDKVPERSTLTFEDT